LVGHVHPVADARAGAARQHQRQRRRAGQHLHLGFRAGGLDDLHRCRHALAVVGQAQVGRPDPPAQVPAGMGGMRWRHGPAQPGGFQGLPVVADAPMQHVHRRRADELRDEEVGGPVEELQRRAGLLDPALAHDDDLVGHGHGLDLVVGDVDGGGAQALVQLADLGTHLHTQLGVQVRQRFVEQEDLRVAHDGAPHRHALALPARELARVALEQLVQVEDARRVLDAAALLGVGHPRQREREAHVLAHGHVRVQRIALEHHRHVAFLGQQVVDDATVDADHPGADVLQPGEHAQQRGLAAARGADQHGERTVRDLDADLVQHRHRAELLAHPLDADGCHRAQPCASATLAPLAIEPTMASSTRMARAPSAASGAACAWPAAARANSRSSAA
jgi:hypothetical protein